MKYLYKISTTKHLRAILFALMTILMPWTVNALETMTVRDNYNDDKNPTLTTCLPPTNVHFTEGPTTHTVSIAWDLEEGELVQYAMFQAYFTDPSEVPTESLWAPASSNSASWTNLYADYDYTFAIRKYCSETDQSDVVILPFHTLEACPTPTNLTVVENSVGGHSATITWDVNGDYDYWNIEFTTDENFYHDVLYEDYAGNPPFHFGNIQPETTYYVRLKANCVPSGNGESHYSNTVTFTTLVACPAPENLAVNNLTYQSATLNWTGFGDSYKVWYRTAGGEWQNVTTEETTCNLTGLAYETQYEAYVVSDCYSYGTSVSSETISFTTLSPPPCDIVDNFTLVEGSETDHSATFTWDDNGDDVTVMVGPMNFTNHFACFFDDETFPEVLTHNDSNYGFEKAVDGDRNCAKSSNGGQHNTTAEMILTVTLPMEGQLSFNARISSEEDYDKAYFSIDGEIQGNLNGISGNDQWYAYGYTLPAGTHTLRWYYVKNQSVNTNDDCFYVGDIIINSYVVDNWTSFEHATSPFTVTGLNTSTNYFAKAIRNCGTYVQSNDSYVASFWTLPCQPPTGLEVLAVTTEYVAFHFDVEEGVAYQYCIVQEGQTILEYMYNVNTSVAPTYIGYGLLGFHPDTDYVIYARKKCGESEVSQPVSVTFHTLPECATLPTAALPFNEDFEDVQATDTPTENILPECWDYINTSTDDLCGMMPLVYHTPGNAHQGDNYLAFYSYLYDPYYVDPQDQYAIMPPMEDVNTLKMSFFAKTMPACNASFHVGVMSGTDVSTFTTIKSFTSTSLEYEEFTVSFENYTGSGNRIAILMDAATSDNILRGLNIDDITVSQHYVVVDADHDFTDDFEYRFLWELVNGDLTNAWAWGDAAHNGDGSSGLYISNDGGLSNAYDNKSSTMVYASKNFWIEAGIYEFSYDWLANGEYIYDYLRVALVPESVTLEADVNPPYVSNGTTFATNLPEGWIALDGGRRLSDVTGWQTASHEVVVPETGMYKMVFAWRNDDDYGENPPAAIDNVSITAVPCATPVNLAATSIRATSADIIWTGGQDTESYTVNYRPSGIVFTEDFENGIGDWTLRNCYQSTSVYIDCGHSGEYGFRFYYSTNPPQYLISPELIGVTEGMNLEFYYKNVLPNYPETFQVGFSATDNEAASFTFGETITASDTLWHLYSEPIPAGTKYICWKLTSDDQYFLYLDDIVVGAENLAGEWQTINVTGGYLLEATVLTGLSPETPYEFYVYPNCNPDNVSETVYFTTIEICAVPYHFTEDDVRPTSVDLSWMDNPEVDSYTMNYRIAPDFSQGFEDGTMPSGWTQSGLGEWVVTQGYGYNNIGTHFGNYNVTITHTEYEDETFLISPMLDLSGLSNPCLSFWYVNYNWGDTDIDQLYVYYRVNEGEWIELWNTTEEHQVWTSSGAIALPNPSSNYQIGFKMFDDYGHGLGLDDIVIGKADIVYDWQSVTVAGGTRLVSTTLTGLTPETRYEYYVYPDCDPFKPSETNSFMTTELCVVPTDFTVNNISATSVDLSWTDYPELESYTVKYRSARVFDAFFTEDFEDANIDNWTLRNCCENTGVVSYYPSQVHSGNSGFRFFYNTNPPQYLISPELTGVVEGMNLEFYYKNTSSSYPETFQVGFSSTDNETASFTFGDEITASDEQWHLYSQLIPAGTKYICWKLNSNDADCLCIDDIAVGMEQAPAGEWQTLTVAGGTTEVSTTITGLSPETLYEAYVYPDCDPDKRSETNTFTTLELIQETLSLVTGWNWWAPMVQAPASQLRTALGANLLQLKSKEGVVSDDAELIPGQMYKLQINTAVENVTLTGIVVPVNISIVQGANWIGYTGTTANIATALGNFMPATGDKIISQDEGFAIYNGSFWEGTLPQLTHGQGYVYHSLDATTKTITF